MGKNTNASNAFVGNPEEKKAISKAYEYVGE